MIKYNLISMIFFYFINQIIGIFTYKHHIYDIRDFKEDINDIYKYLYHFLKWKESKHKRYSLYWKIYWYSHFVEKSNNQLIYNILLKHQKIINYIIYKRLVKDGFDISLNDIKKLNTKEFLEMNFYKFSLMIRDDIPESCIRLWYEYS